jgi:hypothetical protein
VAFLPAATIDGNPQQHAPRLRNVYSMVACTSYSCDAVSTRDIAAFCASAVMSTAR